MRPLIYGRFPAAKYLSKCFSSTKWLRLIWFDGELIIQSNFGTPHGLRGVKGAEMPMRGHQIELASGKGSQISIGILNRGQII